jgi:hypothetical protein
MQLKVNVPPLPDISLPDPAELPQRMQLVTTGDEDELDIPPPWYSAVFAVNVQLVTVGDEEVLYIPPP